MSEYIITGEDFLYRRFSILDEPRYQAFWKIIEGKKVPTSAAFKTKPNEDGLSVNIAALTTPIESVLDTTAFGLSEISASIPIDLGFECAHNPLEGNYANALIIGDTGRNNSNKKLSASITQVFEFDK